MDTSAPAPTLYAKLVACVFAGADAVRLPDCPSAGLYERADREDAAGRYPEAESGIVQEHRALAHGDATEYRGADLEIGLRIGDVADERE